VRVRVRVRGCDRVNMRVYAWLCTNVCVKYKQIYLVKSCEIATLKVPFVSIRRSVNCAVPHKARTRGFPNRTGFSGGGGRGANPEERNWSIDRLASTRMQH